MNEKSLNLVLISIIILYPWIFTVPQDLYIAEFGYWAVSYELFFSNPGLIPNVAMSCWLTIFIGALTNFLFGGLGIIGFKFAFIIVLYFIFYIVYLLLSPFITKKLLLFSILLSEIFIHITTYTYINYYILTSLFFLLGFLFLYKGLINNKLNLLFIAGLILGLNIFIRFPNILGVSLLFVIIYYELTIGKFEYRQTLKKVFIFVSGYLFAVIAVMFFMKMIGHYDLYIKNISFLLFGSNYNDIGLIEIVVKEHYNAFKYGFLLFLILFSILISGKYWANKKISKFIIIVMGVSLAYLIIYLSQVDTQYYCVYSGIVGLILGSLLWIAYKKFKKTPRFSTIAFASFLIMELVPIGSTAYKHQMIYGMYLAIPVIMIYLFSFKKIKIVDFDISQKSIQSLNAIISLTIIVFSLIVAIYYSGNGSEKRWKMVYGLNHPRLQGIYMTKEFAKTINELTEALNIYQKDFSYILTYEKISTIAYLSDLDPYISTTYPFFYSKDKLKRELAIASTKRTLPLVVRATNNINTKGWPKNKKPVSGGYKNKRNILESFLKKNHYQVVWKNDDFEILIPSQKEDKL